jgi:hypothetical protein
MLERVLVAHGDADYVKELIEHPISPEVEV